MHINDLQCNANIASGNAIDTRAQTACANFNENRFNFTMSSNNPQIYMPNNYPSVPHVAANPFMYYYQQKPANSANVSGKQVSNNTSYGMSADSILSTSQIAARQALSKDLPVSPKNGQCSLRSTFSRPIDAAFQTKKTLYGYKGL